MATRAPVDTPVSLPTSAPTQIPTPAPPPTPTPTPFPAFPSSWVFLDANWYRTTLIHTTDLWNGGINGLTGMGSYSSDFDGCFHVNLNRQWLPMRQDVSTPIAQSRAIYINVETYRIADPGQQERYLKIVRKGVDCLLDYYLDKKYGGFYWQVTVNDNQVVDTQKQGYGNVHALFALAQAYSITKDPAHLEAARNQLAVIEKYFLDPEYPGSIRPGLDRDMTEPVGVNNVDVFTHYFEALLAMYDVTEGVEREHIIGLIITAENFLENRLAAEEAGHPDRMYVAYNYDDQWRPSQEPYTRATQWTGAMHATPAHGVELAYLLSRAVERGFNPEWLELGDRFMNFAMAHCLDPETGGMLYETTDYEGRPLPGNPDNDKMIWWAQSETARAFLHLTVVRGRNYREEFKNIERLIHGPLTDPKYGGWYDYVFEGTELPGGEEKGNIWKVNYHYTMFFAEAWRLSQQYPQRLAALTKQGELHH